MPLTCVTNAYENEGAELLNWLKVVGTGIRLGQLTAEAQRAVSGADVVFGLVSNTPAFEMLRFFNQKIVNLQDCYAIGKERSLTYREMADLVVSPLRDGKNVCFAIYGHPSVFVSPGFLALETARQEGYKTELLPGISSEDSLFCDLEIDPAVHGCQIYCASAFVEQNRRPDPQSILTLWQVSIIGESRLMDQGDSDLHRILCDRLEEIYGPAHPIIFYEAATNTLFPADIWTAPLSSLRTTKVEPCTTIVVPPKDFPDLVKVPLSTQPLKRVVWPG